MKNPIVVTGGDGEFAERVTSLLSREGLAVEAVATGGDAVRLCGNGKGRMIIAPTDLPDMDTPSFLEKVKPGKGRNLVLMVSDVKDRESKIEAIKHGAYDVADKPVDPDTFPMVVRQAVHKQMMYRKLSYLKKLNIVLILMIPVLLTAGMLLAFG